MPTEYGGIGAPQELGYAQITANITTVSTTKVDATGLSVTVTVGSRPVMVEIFGGLQISAAGFIQVFATEDGTTIGGGSYGWSSATNAFLPLIVLVRRTPAAGSHTYKAQWLVNVGTTTATILAGPGTGTAPAYIRVVEI